MSICNTALKGYELHLYGSNKFTETIKLHSSKLLHIKLFVFVFSKTEKCLVVVINNYSPPPCKKKTIKATDKIHRYVTLGLIGTTENSFKTLGVRNWDTKFIAF